MPRPKNALSRREILGGLTLAAARVAGQPRRPKPLEEVVPVKGKAGPNLEPFDRVVLKIMDRHGIPGAALAIAKDGRLVLAKGYGWADLQTGRPVQPDTPFALASLSKTITAVAVLRLVEQNKLGLDDRVFEIIRNVRPPRGARVDPRLGNVTVRQCLNHSGGWDRTVNGDPVNWGPQIARALRVPLPLTVTQFLSFMLSVPLDFAPGTREQYSNVGFILLGEVIAKISGRPYAQYVRENVLKPMGIRGGALHDTDGKYLPGEAQRYLAGTLLGLPPLQLPMVDAAGGWSMSAVDLVRLLTNLDGSRGEPVLGEKARKLMVEPPPRPLKPRPNGTYFGLGWDSVAAEGKTFGYYKEGSYQGMRTFLKRSPAGVNWALLYNASMEFDPEDMQFISNAVQEIRREVERLKKYPDIDLFDEF